MPCIEQATRLENKLILVFSNGDQCIFPFVYLRHFDPSRVHTNGQRTVEVSELSMDIIPELISIADDGKTVTITWTDGTSTFSIDWLLDHRLSDSVTKRTSYRPDPILWGCDVATVVEPMDYSELHESTGLYSWLNSVVLYGFGMLKNVPVAPGGLREVIETFGFPRETNYGAIFNVRTEVNPNNLAYTDLKISPHTDNPYRHPVPTLQLLHCLNDSVTGGDTMLVDGFRIAHDLRIRNPNYFSTLCSTPVKFRFKDKDNWLEFTGPIIQLRTSGEVQAIRHNSRSIQPLDTNLNEILAFYEAYIAMAKMVEDPQYAIAFHLKPGDLYMVENECVLHGRTAIDGRQGERWLQGAYADVDGLLSKWRTLSERSKPDFSTYAHV